MNKPFAGVAGVTLAAIIISVQMCFGLNVVSYTTDADGITCTCNTGIMKVKICQADIVRVAYSPTSTIPTRPIAIVTKTWSTPTFTRTEAGDTISLQTSLIIVKVSKATANVKFTDLSNAVILSEYNKSMTAATVEGVSTYTVNGEFNSPTDEGLYGLGQHQSGTVNYKGFGSLVLSQDYGSKATAVPVIASTKGYGIYWDSYAQTTFTGNVSSNTRYTFVSDCGDVLDYYFFYGPEIDRVISGYRTATGKTPLFPKWAYGLIMSKDRYQSQGEYLAVKDGYRNNNIPIDCIVQDWQYWAGTGGGVQGCFCFNSNWTDVKGMVNTMHNANIHTMISVWSEIEEGSNIYTTLNNMGALWPASCATHFLDTYHSNGRETFWNAIRDVFFLPSAQGWDSWWLDNDEPFEYPCGFGSYNRHSVPTAMGKGCLFYNTYPFLLTRTCYTNWRRDISGKRFVVLHRANFAGQQAHSAMQWSNDINSNFATLANSVPCGLNSTLTGIPYWCTDIGGYWGNGTDFTTAANRELMTRWFQYGAFCPVFRIHGNCESGQGKELYSNTWDATTKANLLLIDKLHYRLMPYIYSLAWMTTHDDYTQMRHLVMDFRTDANVKSIGNQFMYGPAFMVGPVTIQNATSRSVYLPAGRWYDFWTGDTATGTGGRTLTVSAPLNHIPLYMRAGSIVPMGPEIQYATQRADTIELRVYRGANGSFTLYEDEGDNYNYETGSYATIPMSYNDATGKISIGGRSGSFPGMLTNRVFTVVFVTTGHGSDEPKTAAPDCIVNYNGTGVTACPVTGVCAECVSRKLVKEEPFTVRTSEERIVFPAGYAGALKEVAVYDVSGRLLKKAVFKKQTISLRKNFGLSGGTYIVKVRLAQ